MRNIPILMYHSICADDQPVDSEFVVQQSVFDAQLSYIACHGYSTPSPAALLSRSTHDHARELLITFDDGYMDNYELAFPTLQKYGFTALIFLVADFSRRTNWWDRAKGMGEKALMTEHELVEMRKGGIEFGSHTMHHRSLPSLSDAELQEELHQSRAVLEEHLGSPVLWFAYPYGDVDARTKCAVREAGYKAAVATNTGPLCAGNDLLEMRRVPVSNSGSSWYAFVKLSGIDKMQRWGRWRTKRALGRHNKYQDELGYGS